MHISVPNRIGLHCATSDAALRTETLLFCPGEAQVMARDGRGFVLIFNELETIANVWRRERTRSRRAAHAAPARAFWPNAPRARGKSAAKTQKNSRTADHAARLLCP